MDWSDIVNTIKKIAPTAEGLLATFGGAPGLVTAGAIKAITEVFGLTDKATPDDISKAISTDPQAALKLALAEQDFRVKIRESDIEELKAQLGDVQNARSREVEITKTTGKRDPLLFGLAILGVVFPIILVMYLIIFGLPNLTQGEAIMVGGFLGIIIGEYKTIFGYFFGSSQSSSDKTVLLAKSQPIRETEAR